MCAKIKDLRQCAELHLRNGFTKADDPYIHFGDPESFDVRSVLLKDFLPAITAKENVLYSSKIVEPLDEAVRRKNMHVVLDGQSDLLLDCETCQWDQTHSHAKKCSGNIQGAKRATAALTAQGVQDMQGKSCAMIFGTLSEKYRAVEADERAKEEELRRLQRVQFYRGEAFIKLCAGSTLCDDRRLPGKHRLTPPNLASRIKKLDDANASTPTCICDPDCLCAPLCAGEPDEDCLCETNPLFWRVTTGYEIEELLYRAKDELYPFQTRYNRLAQLTMGGLADIHRQPILIHATRLSVHDDSSTFAWYYSTRTFSSRARERCKK